MKIVTLEQANELLNAGKVGVMPTDTIYGVVARAHDSNAVSRLYALKRRERKPGTVIAASIEDLSDLGIPNEVLARVSKYWPNSISVVVPSSLEYLHQQKGSVAVRIPNHDIMNQLTSIVGPILTSSANRPGEPPAQTITEAFEYFGTDVDFYVDGGHVENTKASTIIRMNDDSSIVIIRQGKAVINKQ